MHLPSVSRSQVVLLTVVVLVFLSGCLSLGTGQSELPTEKEVEQTLADLDALEATVVSSFNGTTTERRTLMEIGTGKTRSRTQVGGTENLFVSNGSTAWRYNRSSNTVRVTHISNSGQQFNGSYAESMSSVFASLNAGSDSSDAEVIQLPIIPTSGGDSPQPVTGSIEQFGNASLTYVGTETVDGRETYVVDVAPRERSASTNMTMWIDQEWYFPLRWNSTISTGDDEQTVTISYRNVTFDPEISPGTFEFEPPENATIIEQTFASQSFDSREKLEAATEMTVPTPDVPDDLAFESGIRFDNNGSVSTTLQYTNGSATLRVTKSESIVNDAGLPDGERVEIDGTEGVIRSFGTTTSLVWNCGGYRYSVAGEYPEETLRRVGTSIGCQ
ncbi:MAG: outer membrane lipoprotein-sorting protein [Haloarculaceae archaeon]|jgi:outer membrane lipoprotein-sorting protein